MDENLSKLLKQAKNYPKTGLPDDVWRAIQIKQTKSLKRESFIYSIVGILSLGGFVFVSLSLKKQFSTSGFFQYVSLIFSDGNLLATYWKEYLLTLTDSLPVASLGAFTFLLVSMLISLKKVIHQYKYKLSIN
ncbi:MAG: hypothetical protein WCW54_02475 [Candidatus Paceibacterota bacterium]